MVVSSAMLEKLQKHFEIRVLDLDTENINQIKYGVLVEGPEKMHEVLEWCEIILATGSTVVNATITDYCDLKPALFYGTTGAAAAETDGTGALVSPGRMKQIFKHYN